MTAPDIQFEYLFTLMVEVDDIVSMGEGPLGERRLVPIIGGSFEGPRLRGRVLGGGADWQIVRGDGVVDLDARYALEDSDGNRIKVISQGYRHGPPEVLMALARGEEVDPHRYVFRTAMRFETGARNLAWLNTTLAMTTAQRHARRVDLRAWRIL